jgi:hypothetical protein
MALSLNYIVTLRWPRAIRPWKAAGLGPIILRGSLSLSSGGRSRAGPVRPHLKMADHGWRLQATLRHSSCARRRRENSSFSRKALAIAFGRHGYKTVSLSDNLRFALRTLPSFADHLGK